MKKSDFTFTPTGFGRYTVTYESPKTGYTWSADVDFMPIIDATKNADNPKQVDLVRLKRICKDQCFLHKTGR